MSRSTVLSLCLRLAVPDPTLFCSAINDEENSFIGLKPVPNVIQLFPTVIYESS
jgi:hypothetical protein